jgi:hypothetical protein
MPLPRQPRAKLSCSVNTLSSTVVMRLLFQFPTRCVPLL